MPIVIASSFADPADVAAYRHAIAQGKTRAEALKLGDDAIGKWGDDTSSPNKPMCALPPEDWQAKWGNGQRARGKLITVIWKGKTVQCELRDTMPHRKNIKNGAGIDLNPGVAKLFGLKPPFMIKNVRWEWAP